MSKQIERASPAYRLLNHLIASGKLKGQFSAESVEAIYHENSHKIRITQDLKFGAEGFEKHANTRAQDYRAFKTPFGGNKEETLDKILKKPADQNAANKVNAELQTIFASKPFYTAAQATYKESMEVFTQYIEENPQQSAESLRGYLAAINDGARKAIQAQQINEETLFKAKVDDLAKDIAAANGSTTPSSAELNEIKNTLLADLKSAHDQQLSEFDNSIQANLTLIDKASTIEKQHIIFAGQLHSWAGQLGNANKEKMLEEIERAREINRARKNLITPNDNLHISVNVDKGVANDLNPEDLQFFISLTGKKINHIKEGSGPGKWTVHLDHRILNPGYYTSRQENPKVDALSLCQAVRACGYDAIILTCDSKDEKTQNDRLRQAFEAALESGFNPEDEGIILRNGKGETIDPKTLYANQPGKYEQLVKEAEGTRAKLDKFIKKDSSAAPSTTDIAGYREGINQIREKSKAVDRAKEEQYEEEINKIIPPPTAVI